MSKRVVAFDLVNTVLDVSRVPSVDVRAYVKHIYAYRETGVYQKLVVGPGWLKAEPFPEAIEGLKLLKAKGYQIVTCSNLPGDVQEMLCDQLGLPFDGIVRLEAVHAFKTAEVCYRAVCAQCHCEPADVTFVSANKDFGDIEASRSIGMTPALIRCEGADYADLIALAESL